MQIITGQAVSDMCDYSFGDQRASWDSNLIGGFMKPANATNQEFLAKAKEFEGRIMTLYIDNIRLYPREVITTSEADKQMVFRLMLTNNLLALCSLLPNNRFIIFTGQEDTAIDEYIRLPFNVVKIYATNAIYNTDRIVPFPYGLQRQIGLNDNRLEVMKNWLEVYEPARFLDIEQPEKLLYINCGIERNPEREPLRKFETNDWCTTRFDKDSKFYPYERYNEFLDELRDHKFVVCPKGRGIDTHRIYETLYMRRVPVMLDHPYFRRLLEGFPVLFIANWNQITKDLLSLSMGNKLYEQAQTMDMSKLDLEVLYKNAVNLG